MLSVVSGANIGAASGGGMGAARRELAAQRDRQVRLHSVRRDLQLDLPPSIRLPDGEELPYGASATLHIRHHDQESEIYQKCIRAPPNRTVLESESPPPYRSSSAGVLGGGEWGAAPGSAPLVVRCHSLSAPDPAQPRPDFLQRTVNILTGRRRPDNT